MLVVAVGGHNHATGGDSCHALACRLVKTLAVVTSCGRIHGGRDQELDQEAHLQSRLWETTAPGLRLQGGNAPRGDCLLLEVGIALSSSCAQLYLLL